MKKQSISPMVLDTLEMARKELEEADWEGLIISGQGRDFSLGTDLRFLDASIDAGDWDVIDLYLKKAQQIYMANKYSEKPVITAISGKTLGSGCEMAMHSTAVQALGETYMGMAEFGLGLVPACGGVKEMIVRALSNMTPIRGTKVFQDYLFPKLEALVMVKISTSAKEAKNFGYLNSYSDLTFNDEYLISDAKKKILHMLETGYTAPEHKILTAPGKSGVAFLKVMGKSLLWANNISEHDYLVFSRLVDIMGGGGVDAGTLINEEYLLDLERETFLSLAGEKKTRDRIKHMLTTGKPLRN